MHLQNHGLCLTWNELFWGVLCFWSVLRIESMVGPGKHVPFLVFVHLGGLFSLCFSLNLDLFFHFASLLISGCFSDFSHSSSSESEFGYVVSLGCVVLKHFGNLMYSWTRRNRTICFVHFFCLVSLFLILFLLFSFFILCRFLLSFFRLAFIFFISFLGLFLFFCGPFSGVSLLNFSFFRHLPLVFHCQCDNSSALHILHFQPCLFEFVRFIFWFCLLLLWYMFFLFFFFVFVNLVILQNFCVSPLLPSSSLAHPRNSFVLFGQLKLGPVFFPALEPWKG